MGSGQPRTGCGIGSGRNFNLEKQTQEYDPERRYIKHWQCDTKPQPLDVVDHVDWPIMLEQPQTMQRAVLDRAHEDYDSQLNKQAAR